MCVSYMVVYTIMKPEILVQNNVRCLYFKITVACPISVSRVAMTSLSKQHTDFNKNVYELSDR